MTDIATEIHNERTKLTANWLNGLAIALAAVGGFAPAASYLSTGSGQTTTLTITALGCVFTSAALHWLARRLLGRLR